MCHNNSYMVISQKCFCLARIYFSQECLFFTNCLKNVPCTYCRIMLSGAIKMHKTVHHLFFTPWGFNWYRYCIRMDYLASTSVPTLLMHIAFLYWCHIWVNNIPTYLTYVCQMYCFSCSTKKSGSIKVNVFLFNKFHYSTFSFKHV